MLGRRFFEWLARIAGVATIISAIPLVLVGLAWMYPRTVWLKNWFTSNGWEIWAIFITCSVLALGAQMIRLLRRFGVVFEDRFLMARELKDRWEFEGDWRIFERGELVVTNSDAGGISKVGSFWENYEYEFETKIQHSCSSWIVRARSLRENYMFQLSLDAKKIRPHIRVQTPVVDEKGQLKGLHIGWLTLEQLAQPYGKEIRQDEWFGVKNIVRGREIQIQIKLPDEKEFKTVFSNETIVDIPAGKVGFRNCGREKALFRNVRVRLLD